MCSAQYEKELLHTFSHLLWVKKVFQSLRKELFPELELETYPVSFFGVIQTQIKHFGARMVHFIQKVFASFKREFLRLSFHSNELIL